MPIGHSESVERLADLKRSLGHKLSTLKRQLEISIAKGYPFAGPHVGIFMDIAKLEVQINEMAYIVQRGEE